ncbi:MAG: MFS transporter [Pyramidobacter sp.]|nr:MFS transporter [Pyramidobacter sp.]
MSEKAAFPWKIVLAAAAILGGAQGVIINTNGVIFAAIVRETGFRAGDLALYYTIMYVVSALCVPFTSRLFFTKNSRAVMAALGSFFTLSFGAMCFYTRLWHWYAAAVASGLGYSCMMVAVTTTLNGWFAAKKGLVAGATLSVTGILGALLAPVCASCILAFGWRATAVLMGGLAFAMIVLFGAFALVPSPEREGKKPWGSAPLEEAPAAGRPRIAPPYVFFLCLTALACLNALFQFNLQLPLFARTFGYSLSAGAVLTSCSMIGNIAGKLALGLAIDRFGAYRGGAMLAGSLFASFAIFCASPSCYPALCLAATLFGGCFSVGGVLLPQLALAVWGRDRYRPYVSRFTSFNAFAAAFTGSAFPYIHDFTGSWTPALVLCMTMCACAAAIFLFLKRDAKRWPE